MLYYTDVRYEVQAGPQGSKQKGMGRKDRQKAVRTEPPPTVMNESTAHNVTYTPTELLPQSPKIETCY